MKYFLHYVGNKLYPKETFIAEAEKIGVNRCVPLMFMHRLHWGDKILLGIFHQAVIPKEIVSVPSENGELTTGQTEEINGRLNKCGKWNRKDGTADVFGYFVLQGLNLTASKEYKDRFTSLLNVVETKEMNQKIQRQCGSYTLGTSRVVTNTIEEIVEIAQQLEVEMNEHARFFLGGQFFPLSATLTPATFSRALIQVEIDATLTIEEMKQGNIGLILDYDKRTYIPKHSRRGRPRKS
jgi:hypothetical protein